ncbi:uncharacterized protein METZ01_LOCUS63547 [marine metagenome]|uniref:Molybdopterin oxidoreductase N-terminal domain-containing protein n=1 Tax=marine metagenome TaxID=408172 RepID=A0A381TA35_9ZZZZ|tara:strand:+ start:584 stop:751 length:168 start_codon:yes stop_codon:yes gene_type:complete
MNRKTTQEKITATHWGAYKAVLKDNKLVEMRGVDSDVEPSPFAQSYVEISPILFG